MNTFKCSFLAILLALSFQAKSQDIPLANVTVESIITNEKMEINNLSNESFTIDLYGKQFQLVPTSGLTFECQGNTYIEILLPETIHDYFEVECHSKVTFTPSFIISK
ncbi:hypothetical protein [Shewanella sp. 6_MG-2023]|uniref:hypothetical protein n=1 Tax=Shewanella sp. 6_MG-2023 TaxID=3062660 RepID=UPI0026E450C4|nr:hypothetical protein [Shewanella sp. 6_MG-2023]MDO6620853.1 hypothetical protein [Shewanella sp. 6_MG-2023]